MKHGGDLSEAIARYGGTQAEWLDLSTGINPNPWPVEEKALYKASHRLPAQAEIIRLLAAARDFFEPPQDAAIIAAPGVQSLIQWLPYLSTEGSTAILWPTYNEYDEAWSGAARSLSHLGTLSEMRDEHRCLICVNPNNPDGRLSSLDHLTDLAAKMKVRDGWLIVDESFIETMPEKSAISLCAEFPVLILRSFGKFFGLPGLRLGFLITQERIASRFRHVLGPWPVTSQALAVGTAAYADHVWIRQAREMLAVMSNKLDAVLIASGLTIIGGTTLFRLASAPDAKGLHDHLARKHIWCRCFDHDAALLRFGLPANDDDLERLERALQRKDFIS